MWFDLGQAQVFSFGMKTLNPFRMIPLLCVSLWGTPLVAEESGGPAPGGPPADERILKFEAAEKLQVRHSMIGFTSTRIFYTFAASKAVLVLNIDNTTADFKTTGSLVVFAPEADAEAIGKWVNNAHSCGLFIDPAEPTAIHALPEGFATAAAREIAGEEKHPMTEEPYSDYRLRVTIPEHRMEGQFILHAFEDDANVYLKVGSL